MYVGLSDIADTLYKSELILLCIIASVV